MTTTARISTAVTSKSGTIAVDLTISGRAFKSADRAARATHGMGIAALPIETAAGLLTGAADPLLIDTLNRVGTTTVAAELTVRIETLRQMLTGAESEVLRWQH